MAEGNCSAGERPAARGRDGHCLVSALPVRRTSNTPAAPMPPPMHIVTTTFFAPRRLPSISAWPVRRWPRHAIGVADGDRAAVDVQPIGRDAELVAAVDTCTAKASLSSHRSMSLDLQAQALQQLRDREHRADAHLVGLAAGDREAEEAAQRLQALLLGVLRRSSRTQAPPPSENWLALPAEITPPGIAGRMPLIASLVVPARMPSSSRS